MNAKMTWMILAGGLFLGGCGPEAPSVRYGGHTLAAKEVSKLQVYRAGKPDRPYQDLGTVDVSCPTVLSSSGFGTANVEGGCSYEEAVGMARERAAASGADGIYALSTSAAGNGSIVSLTAVAVRFTTATAPEPEPQPATGGSGPAFQTVEVRLQKLKQLNDQKLITDDEYARRKAEILHEL